MRVCLLSMEWPPYGGGIGSYMFNLARGLVSAGHQVTVITHDRNPVATSAVRMISIPLPVACKTVFGQAKKGVCRIIGGIRYPWQWEARIAFQRLLSAEPIDIVETAEFGAWGWHLLGDAHVPIAVRCHTPTHVVWSVSQVASGSGGMPGSLRKQDGLEREQVYRADGIASPSHALAYHLSLGWTIPLSRFVVIPNPIDAELFRPAERSREGREILYAGRLEYNKGVYDLAEAIPAVLETHRDVSVHFVGMDRPAPCHLLSRGKTAVDVIRSLVPEQFHDRLLFTPHVPVTEIVRLQQNATLSVMPTRGFESFSYTALEAMACGTPVIATQCGGPGEIITHEVDGLLVPPGRPTSLAEAMLRLLADTSLRQHLGMGGRQTVETRFSMPVVLPRILEWYKDVIREFKASQP